jgi:hypothetical protein
MKSLIANQMVQSFLRKHCRDYNYIAEALDCPIDPNHAPRHQALAIMAAAEARKRAEVYCFDNTAWLIALQMMQTLRRRQYVFASCRPLFPRMFFEFEHDRGRDCIYVEGSRIDCWIGYITRYNDDPVLAFSIPHVNFDVLAETNRLPERFDCCTYEYGPLKTRELVDLSYIANFTTYNVAAFWTFLCLGSVATISHHITREGRIASKRGKLHAMGAIDSYNSVTLNLPRRNYSNTATQHFKRGPGVRWHTVAGHWREYKPNERRILGWMTWIADHERGDARKGVVIKDRNIRARAE